MQYLRSVVDVFLAGVLAGLSVAVPVGAVAVLVVDTAVNRGFRLAAVGGAGIATADALFALVAAIAGGLLARLLEPWTVGLQVAAIVTLLVLMARGLMSFPWSGARSPPAAHAHDLSDVEAASPARTFAVFLKGALVHPVTVIAFLALIVGLAPTGTSPGQKGAFIAGVALASLGWQWGLAGYGARRRRQVSFRARRLVLLLDVVLVFGFIAYIGLGLFQTS